MSDDRTSWVPAPTRYSTMTAVYDTGPMGNRIEVFGLGRAEAAGLAEKIHELITAEMIYADVTAHLEDETKPR